MAKVTKAQVYLEERNSGMTMREIAEKYGVSYQCVSSCVVREDPRYNKKITPKGCIYPNLRRWLNEDLDRQREFLLALKGKGVRDYLKGKTFPKKDVIDKMIRLTGMPYEVLFAEEIEK